MGITGGYKLFDFSQFEGCGTDGLCALMQIDAAKRLSLGMFDDFNIFQLFSVAMLNGGYFKGMSENIFSTIVANLDWIPYSMGVGDPCDGMDFSFNPMSRLQFGHLVECINRLAAEYPRVSFSSNFGRYEDFRSRQTCFVDSEKGRTIVDYSFGFMDVQGVRDELKGEMDSQVAHVDEAECPSDGDAEGFENLALSCIPHLGVEPSERIESNDLVVQQSRGYTMSISCDSGLYNNLVQFNNLPHGGEIVKRFVFDRCKDKLGEVVDCLASYDLGPGFWGLNPILDLCDAHGGFAAYLKANPFVTRHDENGRPTYLPKVFTGGYGAIQASIHAGGGTRSFSAVIADGSCGAASSFYPTLFASEVAVAESMLYLGGVLLIKLHASRTYDVFCNSRVVNFLNSFDGVVLVKPSASSVKNDEVYLCFYGAFTSSGDLVGRLAQRIGSFFSRIRNDRTTLVIGEKIPKKQSPCLCKNQCIGCYSCFRRYDSHFIVRGIGSTERLYLNAMSSADFEGYSVEPFQVGPFFSDLKSKSYRICGVLMTPNMWKYLALVLSGQVSVRPPFITSRGVKLVFENVGYLAFIKDPYYFDQTVRPSWVMAGLTQYFKSLATCHNYR